MDIGNISKVANRRRLLDDIQEIGDKVSKENAELVKLQIANDTAFWEMKEKLAQKKSDHEKLQQNMVTLQMQYETLSAKYQEELRLRPEVLNKLDANRKIYEVLQEHMERLMQSISQMKVDKAALYDAYMKSDKVVRDLKQSHIQEVEKARHNIELLERTVKTANENQTQLTQVFSACKQQSDVEMREIKEKLGAVLSAKEELALTVSDLNRQLDTAKFDIKKRDEKISTLHEDVKQMIDSFNGQVAEARSILLKKDNELKSNANEMELLKRALANQESFAKDARDQSDALQETLAELDQNYQAVVAERDGFRVNFEKLTATSDKLNSDIALLKEQNDGLVNEVNNKCQVMTAMSDKLNSDIASLKEENDGLVKELNNKCQVLNSYEEELKKLKDQIITKDELINQSEDNIQKLSVDLNNVIEESESKSEQILTLASEIEALNKIIADTDAAFKNYREAAEDKDKKKIATIDELNKELEAKAAVNIQVLMELQTNAEEQTRLKEALKNVEEEKKLEMKKSEEMENKFHNKLAQLETMIKNKDEELSRQMSRFLESRNESEREKNCLREKNNALQLKLEHIRKETTMETRAPEPNDNAVMMTPEHEPVGPNTVRPSGALTRDSFEDMYRFSDRSHDGDSLDSQEISRRFAALARGDPVSPVHVAMLKRRRVDTPMRMHLTPQAKPQPQPKTQPQKQSQRENTFTIPQPTQVKKERRFFKSVANDTGKIKKTK